MRRHPGASITPSAASTHRAPTAPAARLPLSSLRHNSSLLSHSSNGSNSKAGNHFGRSSIGSSASAFSSTSRASWSKTSSSSRSHAASQFIPHAAVGGPHKIEPLGTGIPSFRTSFDVSGNGGGAFRPISDSFAVNPANGTMSLSLPIQLSPTRAGGLSPNIKLSYDSGSGNGPFGFGWTVGLGSVQRKTKDGVPVYVDSLDAFTMGGADIVPALEGDGKTTVRVGIGEFEVATFRPRVDSGMMRIEKWSRNSDSTDVHWRVVSAENVTSIYGLNDQSRIMSKIAGKRHIATWLLSRSFDGNGNAVEYVYKAEDGIGVSGSDGMVPIWEANRTQESRCHQKYIKRIFYGNRTPCRNLDSWKATDEAWPKSDDWMFQVVFDHGEHSKGDPGTLETKSWAVRQDPFSQNNFGFEIRTYRLCRRILMFHHFHKETGWQENLVASSHIGYLESPQATFLSRYTINRHVVDESATREPEMESVGAGKLHYRTESFPPWTFDYTKPPSPNQMKGAQANVANVMELPQTGSNVCEWLDLDGEGIPGLLTRLNDGTMCYQQNRGGLDHTDEPFNDPSSTSAAFSQFSVPECLPQQPTLGRSPGTGRFEDLDHTGHVNLVHLGPDGEPQGFWERDDSDSWSVYSEFPPTPSSEFSKGPGDTLSMDLTGDGLPDLLYAAGGDSREIVWEQNLGKQGRTTSRRTLSVASADHPRLGSSQAAETQTFVADMTGDGLADLVEISQASIKFWPNQGHGRFGYVQQMGSPPVFACGGDDGDPGGFDPVRLRLIDIDGNGLTDVLYLLPAGGAHVYFNQAGNSWSRRHFVRALPATAVPSSVFTLDLFGRGSGCLCWAEASGSSGEVELRYIDLMGGGKPHLLREYTNGFGAVTTVSYEPSTAFYLKARRSATPWSSRLPFPVQCLSKVTVRDQITGNTTTTTYSYHNGHYDSVEKAFAGFEMVEQWKTERLMLGKDETYESPTLYTKSWFGIGKGLMVEAQALFSPSLLTSKLQSLTQANKNMSEAFQVLKGTPLRTEMYSLDGTPNESIPYSVEEFCYDIKELQPKGPSKHGVFQLVPRSSVTTEYGRRPRDPKVSQAIVLRSNDYGDVEESVTVVYPRSKEFATFVSHGDSDVIRNQTAGNVSHDRVWFTNPAGSVETGCWRKPIAWRHQSHEILGFKFPSRGILDVDEIRLMDFGSLPEMKSIGGTTETVRGLRSEERTIFLDNTLNTCLADGKIDEFSVVHKSYTLAFDVHVLSKIKANQEKCHVLGADLESELLSAGGYVKLDQDSNWWAPSVHVQFRSSDSPPESELGAARRRFYTPARHIDPFGNLSSLYLDGNLLLAAEVQNALGGKITFQNDYQQLQPVVVTDQNGIRQSVSLNTLGQTTCAGLLGKEFRPGDEVELDVDSLDDVQVEVTDEEVESVLRDPCGSTTKRLLGNAGSRVIYALHRCHNSTGTVSPAVIIGIARNSSFRRSENPILRVNVTYLDGHGAPVQSFVLNDPTKPAERWIATGITTGDVSSQVVRTYHPFFVSSPDFIFNSALDRPGSTALFDGVGHEVASLTLDGVWSKTVYTPWSLTEHDFGTMGMCSTPEFDPHVGHLLLRVQAARYRPGWFRSFDSSAGSDRRDLMKSAVYFGSTTTTHLGSCGLPIRSVHSVPGKTYLHSRSLAYDISGNKVRDFDALGRLVEKNVYDKLDRPVLCSSMDAGDVGTILDVNGSTICSWNSRSVCFLYEYDALRRETGKLLVNGVADPVLVTAATYGESAPPEIAHTANLRGNVWKIHDQSGVHINDRFDVRGNLVESSFLMANEYKSILDWKTPDQVSLAPHAFSQTASCDSFGQVVSETDAKGNKTSKTFSRLGHVVGVKFHHTELEEAKSCLLDATFAADGLPLSKTYNNGVRTTYSYDDVSRRLIRELTLRKAAGGRHEVVQDLSHVYDSTGRRIRTEDAADQTKYFRGCSVAACWEYTYDALGQLTESWGRGQLPAGGKGQGGRDVRLVAHNAMRGSKPAQGTTDGTRLYRYCESYTYDVCGNILSMRHAAPDDQFVSGWTRRYYYEEVSPLSVDGSINSNRLSRTMVGETEEKYGYVGDAGLVGCITDLPRFSLLRWNMDNMLTASSGQELDIGTPEMTYYVYDYVGRRVRKVTECSTPAPSDDTALRGPFRRTRDTLYLSGVEVQMRMASDGSTTASSRTIARVASSPGDILSLVESSSDSSDVLERYQIGFNLELDDNGRLVTYEEYSPFGTVMYTASHQAVEAPRSYRFARYEHDRETGLYHCGSRYYCPWLGRWTSPDPFGDVDGPNLFVYCSNDPVGLDDHPGTSAFSKAGRDPTKVPGRQHTVDRATGVTHVFKKNGDGSPFKAGNPSHDANPKDQGAYVAAKHGFKLVARPWQAEEVKSNNKMFASLKTDPLSQPTKGSNHLPPIHKQAGGGNDKISRGRTKTTNNNNTTATGQDRNASSKLYGTKASTGVMQEGMVTAARNFLQTAANTIAYLENVKRGDKQPEWDQAVDNLNSQFDEVKASLANKSLSSGEKAKEMKGLIRSIEDFGKQASDNLKGGMKNTMYQSYKEINNLDKNEKSTSLNISWPVGDMSEDVEKFEALGKVVFNNRARLLSVYKGGKK